MKRWTMWIAGAGVAATLALAASGCARLTETPATASSDQYGPYASPVTPEYPGRPTFPPHTEGP